MASFTIPSEAPALIVHDAKTKSLSIETLPVPKITGLDDHLIQVHAVAITNGELLWPEPAAVEKPIPGYELSGAVVKGPSESPFPPGTEVYARTAFERAGSARPFSIATTQELGRKSAVLTWEEAATVPLSALTAWQALFVHGGIGVPDQEICRKQNATKRVLVTAAAGGVGIWAVQLAALAGAHVVGTSGPANIDFVRGLGAKEVIDYKSTNLDSWINERPSERKFDLVLDCVGGETMRQGWRAVKPDGKLVSIVDPPEKERPETGVSDGVSGSFFIVEADSEQLNKISTLIEQGKRQTAVDSVYPLEDFENAFKRAYGGHARGKVVLNIHQN